jgi:hypothetical protein
MEIPNPGWSIEIAYRYFTLRSLIWIVTILEVLYKYSIRILYKASPLIWIDILHRDP